MSSRIIFAKKIVRIDSHFWRGQFSPPSFQNSLSREFLLKTQLTTPTALSQLPAVFVCDARHANFTTTRRFHPQPATRSSLFRAAQAIPTRAPSSNDLVRSVTNSSTILPESLPQRVRMHLHIRELTACLQCRIAFCPRSHHRPSRSRRGG